MNEKFKMVEFRECDGGVEYRCRMPTWIRYYDGGAETLLDPIDWEWSGWAIVELTK